jgi:hypothetical protein
MKNIKIALKDTPHDYPSSLVPILMDFLGYQISWVKEAQADLVIQGPFVKKDHKLFRWLPKPLRPSAQYVKEQVNAFTSSSSLNSKLRLFQTSENIRPDITVSDFALSYDLGIQDPKHCRFPYWMEMVDWSKEGIQGNTNPRYGRLLNIEQMMRPLGNHFLTRERHALLISSHLLEPRKTIYQAVNQVVPVKGLGAYFNPEIKNHHQSGFDKFDELQHVAFNLCPENGLFPGYYTEKIPEAFLAGCLPITWTDQNVQVDFNPKAMINLESMHWNQFAELPDLLLNETRLAAFADEPLMLNRPSIEPTISFLREVCRQATS